MFCRSLILSKLALGAPTRPYSCLRRTNQGVFQPKSVITQKRDIHPAAIIIGKQLAKFVAVLTGRGFRKWWSNLPNPKRRYFQQKINENRGRIAAGFGFTGSVILVYYVTHIQETPLTHRRRFIAFSPQQFKKISQFEFEVQYESFKDQIYDVSHPSVRRVQRVAHRLLESNRDIDEIFDKEWSVSVVNAPLQNAFVLPSGQIFVFSGMLSLCENDDQLGCVLAHEMAHAVLGHGAELISYAHLVDVFVIIVLAGIWAFLPSDGIAAISHWFFNKVVDITVHLPYSRKLETEADVVGLQLGAKACFDIRESSAFWAKMALLAELSSEGTEVPQFLSSHPAHEARSETLDNLMNEALEKRIECSCPPLPRRDPRLNVDVVRQQVQAVKTLRDSKEGIAMIPIKR